ncbi:hypothetical protein PoB_005542100 [Plakobranchus ocellatus]|uniref:Uncharacterized protein n=1 Tax=Plakobranchus ocellatus TaxID=259542 RepID=A0AAV4C0M2_9GAST|nr:hypothetical protein PoB_005542100 [Plakobranchus ocellatus]
MARLSGFQTPILPPVLVALAMHGLIVPATTNSGGIGSGSQAGANGSDVATKINGQFEFECPDDCVTCFPPSSVCSPASPVQCCTAYNQACLFVPALNGLFCQACFPTSAPCNPTVPNGYEGSCCPGNVCFNNICIRTPAIPIG